MIDIPGQVLSSSAKKVCVSAAPGAGKTSDILVPKLRQILAASEVDPRAVLLLTFSRMSAVDLQNKVRSLDRSPIATTVHSYALRFLLSEDSHDIRKRIESIVFDFEKAVLVSDLKIALPHIRRNDLKTLLADFSAGWALAQADSLFDEDDTRKSFKYAVINWLTEHEAAMM